MEKQKFNIVLSDNEFWMVKEDASGEYQEKPDWQSLDKLANGFRWSMQHIRPGQRKYRNSAAITLSIVAMLGLVQWHLKDGARDVIVMTPDIEVTFYKD